MSVLGFDMENSSQELTMEAQRRMIIRGKRTKRSRPSAVMTSSSSERSLESDAYFSIQSPQSCENSASTEEDEDMANCLILLAQSGSSFNPKKDHSNYNGIYTKKFTSRKFNEMASSTSEKTELFAYECKTCNRSFPSFQALGGHRASHKKPKNTIEEKRMATILNDKEDQENINFKKISAPSISLQKTKVHECSICGSEFSSGQALGGHMRRHRIPISNTTTSTIIDHHDDDEKPRNHHVLQLDLNLPAPEDDHYDSKFQFVFSPALVDCHY